MDEDSIGLAVVKREGWKFCTQCNCQAPPGEEIVHKDWCEPYTPSRWERFKRWLGR